MSQLQSRAAKKLSWGREDVLSRLRKNAETAYESGNIQASNRALELIGKELKMFVDRKQVRASIRRSAEEMTDEELMALMENDEPVNDADGDETDE